MAGESAKSTKPAPDTKSASDTGKASGYHVGAVDTVISVDDVNRQAKAIAETVTKDQISGSGRG